MTCSLIYCGDLECRFESGIEGTRQNDNGEF